MLEYIVLKINKNQKRKVILLALGFGVGEKIPLDEAQKWVKKVERYNINADNPIDPKKDVMPGPNAYPITLDWKGKPDKKNKNKSQKKHILDTITTRPVVSAYYRKV